MTSKALLFSKGLFKSSVRRNWWIAAIYSIMLFLVLPIPLVLTGPENRGFHVDNQVKGGQMLNLFENVFEIQLFALIVIPAVTAVFVFAYMHKTKQTSFIHSLPCNKRQVYISNMLSGLTLLALPLVLNVAAISLVKAFTEWNSFISWEHIFGWAALTFMYMIIFYSVSVFVGMFTGNPVAHIIFNYIFHVLIPGFVEMIYVGAKILLKGFPFHTSFGWSYLPLFSVFDVQNMLEERSGFLTVLAVSYIVVSAVLLVGAYAAYKFKPAESAGNIVAFRFMNYLFKYGVAVCSTLLFGIFVATVTRRDFWGLLIGAAIGSFIGYWVAEMLIHKSFGVWRAYKGYAVYVVLVLAVLIGVKADITGYVRRVPEIDQVEWVYFGPNARAMMEDESDFPEGDTPDDSRQYYKRYYNTAKLDKREDIENIAAFHGQLVNDAEGTEKGVTYSTHIIYVLKNGRKMIREYSYDENRMLEFLLPIYNSADFKKAVIPLATDDAQDIKHLEISNTRFPELSAVIIDKKEVEEFLQAYRRDILNIRYEANPLYMQYGYRVRAVYDREEQAGEGEMVEYGYEYYSIDGGFALDSAFGNTVNWLKQKGYYDKVELKLEMVEAMAVQKQEEFDKSGVVMREYAAGNVGRYFPPDSDWFPSGEGDGNVVEIKDDTVKEQVVRLLLGGRYYRGKTVAGFLYMKVRINDVLRTHQEVVYKDTDLYEVLKPYME